MANVTRYVCFVSTGELDYEPHPKGQWVDYEDHTAIVEELYEEIRQLHEEVEAAEGRLSS